MNKLLSGVDQVEDRELIAQAKLRCAEPEEITAEDNNAQVCYIYIIVLYISYRYSKINKSMYYIYYY